MPPVRGQVIAINGELLSVRSVEIDMWISFKIHRSLPACYMLVSTLAISVLIQMSLNTHIYDVEQIVVDTGKPSNW